jgi:energy-coupling factor transporter ATP-binding protein EcfA2
MLVVDEPEVYLHPDVQRQLLGIVRDMGPDVLLATHSTEIMAEADPSEILVVDKRKRTGERLKDVSGVQRALDSVGSIQNIALTALARNRRVLFVEGDDDFRTLRRFARRIGLSDLGASFGITPLASGGFGSWHKITTLAGGIGETLGASLTIGAIYDRDYFCQEEIAQVEGELTKSLALAHVHERKEMENYLLIPSALDRAIARGLADRQARSGKVEAQVPKAADLLHEITSPLRDDVQSQIIARRAAYLRRSGKDLADITRETLAWFSTRWEDPLLRLTLVSGKDVLRTFRERIQTALGISITTSRIVDAMHRDEIPADLIKLLGALDDFRRKSV